MRDGRHPTRGALLVVTGALLFVVNAGVSRVIQSAGVGSATLTTVRCTGTALVLLLVVALRRELRLVVPENRQALLATVAFGITGVAMVQWLYFVAIDRLPVGVALLLEFTAPVLVALFARFGYGEHVRARLWAGLACSLGGLALVTEIWSGLALDVIGVLAGLGAAVSLAAYFLLGEHSVATRPPLAVLTGAFVVATVFWNIAAPLSALGSVDLGGQVSLGGNLSEYDVSLWALIVWMVVLGTVAPFLAELSALRDLSATEVGLIGMVEPVGATVLGWLWFEENLSAVQVVGIAIVLVGIALAQTARNVPLTAETRLMT
ncbi:MAG TPA: EamA family transporter [Nocardioidaceae bacterium]|jgi:drug/metabolite transporter (DMT)-like permease